MAASRAGLFREDSKWPKDNMPLICSASAAALLQLDREKQAEQLLAELASIISRYRGPLLESSIDLEQRLWHLATMTGEVWLYGMVMLTCLQRTVCCVASGCCTVPIVF